MINLHFYPQTAAILRVASVLETEWEEDTKKEKDNSRCWAPGLLHTIKNTTATYILWSYANILIIMYK